MAEYERTQVIFLLTPPESLRDCDDIDRIKRVLWANVDALIHEMAETIRKGFTSEPLDPAPVAAVIDNLEKHKQDLIEARRKREACPLPPPFGPGAT